MERLYNIIKLPLRFKRFCCNGEKLLHSNESEAAKKLLEVVENDYLVIDANGFLQNVIFSKGINYVAVGLPATKEDK